MRLTELEPYFLKVIDDKSRQIVPTLAEADGIGFLCPKCFLKNNGNVGTEHIICWFRGKVPDHFDPKPGRWTPAGTGFSDLTFVPGEPKLATSVQVGDHTHFMVENGEVRIC